MEIINHLFLDEAVAKSVRKFARTDKVIIDEITKKKKEKKRRARVRLEKRRSVRVSQSVLSFNETVTFTRSKLVSVFPTVYITNVNIIIYDC